MRPKHTQKKIRRYFILCCILFCTDARCSRPLHQLITNVVESQGGSALLIKILNRLGVCTSADTLSRFVQHKVHTGVLKAMKCKGRLGNTPKCFEQARRDESANVSTNHYCDDINNNTAVLRGKWRNNFLNCRECKRKLVVYLGNYFLANVHSFLNIGQTSEPNYIKAAQVH